jgi:MFS family permease
MTARGPVGARWMTLFTLAWLAVWTVQLTPVQLLLPLQLDTPQDDWIRGVVSSGLVLGIGGLAGIIAGPVVGALSDRTPAGRRRRRPWALGAVWFTAVFLIVTGLAEGPWAVGVSWVGVSIGVAVASAAFGALIADQLPPRQRGAASAAVGSSQAVGIVLGVGLVVLLGLGIRDGYLLLAALIAVV